MRFPPDIFTSHWPHACFAEGQCCIASERCYLSTAMSAMAERKPLRDDGAAARTGLLAPHNFWAQQLPWEEPS